MATDIEYRLKVIEDKLSVALDANSKKAFSLTSALETAAGAFAAIGVSKGLSLLSDGFDFLIDKTFEAIRASADQETAINNLNSALARAGNFSEGASKSLQDFASSLQNASTFADEVITENIALLQSLTTLDEKGLKRATQAAVDFASVTGKDLNTAITLVAKAAEGQTDALSRYGISIDKNIAPTERFEAVLKKLESQFGGGAASKLKTFDGSLQALRLSYGDLLEPIGDIITKNPTLIAAFNELRGFVVNLTSDLTKNASVLSGDLSNAINQIIDLFQGLVTATDFVGRTFTIAFNVITAGIAQISKTFFDLSGTLASFGENIPGIGDKFKEFSDAAQIASETLAESIKQDSQEINDALFNENALSRFNSGLDSLQGKINETAQFIKDNPISPINADQTAAQRAEADRQAAITAALNDGIAERRSLELQAALDSQNTAAEIANLDIQNQFERQDSELQRIAEFEAQKLEIEFNAREEKANLIKDEGQKAAELAKIAKERELAFTKQGNTALLNEEKLRVQKSQQLQAGYLTALSGSLSAASALAVGNAKDQQRIAIAQALVNTYAAGTRAYRDYPFPANLAVLASTIAQGIAQVSAIKSQSFATGGFVGGINGATAGGDNTIANVRTGELVLNADQQRNLLNQINNGSGSPIVIQIDGREIARAVRNQIRQGFSLA